MAVVVSYRHVLQVPLDGLGGLVGAGCPGACVGGEPGRQYLAKQIVGKAEPGLGPDDDPRGSGLFQMSLDRNAKGVLQEARAQYGGIEGRRRQRAHAILREPGQAPLDDVSDGVRARRRTYHTFPSRNFQ